MPKIEPHLVPDEYYSAKDIDRLFAALEKRISKTQEVLHVKEAADFLGVHQRTIHKLSTAGKIPFHKIDGLPGTKFFLRSELIEHLKRR